ncbi:MAG TPA: histone deacetylase family protein [Candidatus Saccharibacteria bacterium]|nr:histone deacetylase family protein [Candidatus Saccharibacteria bacterium]
MRVVYSQSHIQHHPKLELYDGEPTNMPELPDRIETIRRTLLKRSDITWHEPMHYPDEIALAMHDLRYSNYLQTLSHSLENRSDCIASNYIHDTYAPLTRGTWQAARSALDMALTGAELLTELNHPVYVLCRPPGHHAGDSYMGGYCFFNNAGVAAHTLSQKGRVSILDIDYHHGNGTQQIFYNRNEVQYVSVHANPAHQYPYTHGFSDECGVGAGFGYNHNFIVEQHCGWTTYQKALNQALASVEKYSPDYLVVSLGFDGYKDDPIAGFGLNIADYSAIASAIKNLGLPTLLIQEGGYCIDSLGELADAVVSVFTS